MYERALVISASGWGLIYFFPPGCGDRRGETNQWRLVGILISLNLPNEGDRAERRWHLWELGATSQETKENQGGVVSRGAVAVKYPGARVTVPDLNMHHQIKHALLGAWDAANKHPNMHTHIPNA